MSWGVVLSIVVASVALYYVAGAISDAHRRRDMRAFRRLLQETALKEEACLSGAPCLSPECAACVYRGLA